MKNTVEDYMKLPYAIEIVPDDGSYFVKIKELEGCMSVGETKAEALEMIEDAMRAWFQVALEDGINIPLPEAMQEEKYSGKFALRMPKSQHRKLSEAAEREGVSLNQYIVTLLAENNSYHDIKEILNRKFKMLESESEVVGFINEKRPQGKVLSFCERKKRYAGAL